MPHWRSLTDSTYLRAADLLDPNTGTRREFTLDIESVAGGTLVGEGGRKTRRPIVQFKGARKPFGVNATNAKTLTALAGSPMTERWVGLRVTLYVTTTRDLATGEVIDCIRIRPKAGKVADEMPEQEEPAQDGAGEVAT